MKRLIAVAAIATGMLAFAAPASAQWVRLGAQQVGDHRDKDIMRLSHKGVFRRLRVCVRRRAVRFFDFDVVFANGGKQDLQIRKRVGPGLCVGPFDLRGKQRRIDQIILRYETFREKGEQAVVTIYGHR